MHRIFVFTIGLALIGVVVAGLVAPISASAGRATNPCPPSSPRRSGGISEMVSCGERGVRGNRAQFVSAITRPAGDRPFLSQLQH
jgi:hypothetical protein